MSAGEFTTIPARWPDECLDLPPEQLPPRLRSHAGAVLAGSGSELRLQVCRACAAVQYPPRDVCVACLDDGLEWRPVASGARLVASTVLRHSHFPYFQARLPWRIGMVRLDAGPTALVHLDAACLAAPDERLHVRLRRDAAGMAVLFAEPESLSKPTEPNR